MVHRAMVSCAACWLATACGGEDVVQVVYPDARTCEAACDPLAAPGQQGCAAGEKCAALLLRVNEPWCADALHMGCVPAGPAALGAECSWGPVGADTGYDTCAAGLMCASDRTCRDLCGLPGGPREACAGGLTCFAQDGRFDPPAGGEPRYGVCAPGL